MPHISPATLEPPLISEETSTYPQFSRRHFYGSAADDFAFRLYGFLTFIVRNELLYG